MVRYSKGKKYISADEWSRIMSRDYGQKITPHMVHQLCGYYHVPKKEFDGLTFYNDKQVFKMRCMTIGFGDSLRYLIKNGTMPQKNTQQQVSAKPNSVEANDIDTPKDETDMEYCNQELLRKYQDD